MGERFDSDLYGDCRQKQTENRIAELTAQKVLDAQREQMPPHLPRHRKPPTHQDILLGRWAKDMEAMIRSIVWDDEARDSFWVRNIDGDLFQEFSTRDEAYAAQRAYLNSPAEVEA